MSDVDRRLDEIEQQIEADQQREAGLGREIEADAEEASPPKVRPDHPPRGVI